MPIREFDAFRTIMHAIQRKPIKILQNENLIVDGFWFIKIYMVPASYRAHALFGLNMDPLMKLIDLSHKSNLNLLWIWDGMEVKKSLIEGSYRIDSLIKTIKEHSIGNLKAVDRFYQRIINQEESINAVNCILKERKVNFIRAPYYAMAQAVYFQRSINGYFFGSTDFLMFEESEKVITDIDFEQGLVKIIYKNEILEGCRMDSFHFQGACLVLGSEFCSTMPLYAKDFNATEIIQELSRKDSIFDFISTAKYDEKEFYINQFICARNLLKFCPVMTSSGVDFLNDCTSKCNLEQIFGIKLCDFLYEKLFRCEIGADVLNGIAFGMSKERVERLEKIKCCYYGILKNYFEFDLKVVLRDKEISVVDKIPVPENKQSTKLALNSVLNVELKPVDDVDVPDQILILLLCKDPIFKRNFSRKLLCLSRSGGTCGAAEIPHELFTFLLELKYVARLYYNLISSIEMFTGSKSEFCINYTLNNALKQKVTDSDIAFLERMVRLFELNSDYLGSDFYVKDVGGFLLQNK